jgi:outer membrane protein TolC
MAWGTWWEIFGDAQLNALETEISVSNQNIAAAANYAAVRAIVRETRSQYFPSVTVGASIAYLRLSVFPAANSLSGATSPNIHFRRRHRGNPNCGDVYGIRCIRLSSPHKPTP